MRWFHPTVLVGLGLSSTLALAATGDVDPSFNGAGQRVLSACAQGCAFHPAAITVQANGNIAIVGNADMTPAGGPASALAFTRLVADGTLDPALAGTPSGDALLPMGIAEYSVGAAITVQPDGKYLLAGRSATTVGSSATPSLVVVRLLADGSPDASFGSGGNGIVSIPMASTAVSAVGDIAVQSDGAIVVSMGVLDTNPYLAQDFYVYRLTSGGNLDSSYGTGGRAFFASAGRTWPKPRLALLADDSAIAVTQAFCDPLIDCALVARIDTSGVLDPSFGNHDFSGRPGYIDRSIFGVSGMALQPDGKALFIGSTSAGTSVFRLTPDGLLDASFGYSGQVVLDTSATINPYNVAVQPDGRIVLGGSWNTLVPLYPMFVRLHTDGSLDQSVQGTGVAIGSTMGVVTTDVLALQPDGNILLATSPGFIVERLLGTGGYDIFSDATKFAAQQYRDFLAREGDPQGIAYWSGQVASGALSRAQVIEQFLESPEFQGTIAPVARLYFAYFLRVPDYGGINFWIGYYRSGNSLDAISDQFAASAEFQSSYGTLDNTQFVTLVYQNVLGRAPDAGGLAFWVNELDTGSRTRGQVMLGFSESPEYISLSAAEVHVTMTYIGMLRRVPDPSGFAFWVQYLEQGNPGLALIDGMLNSSEYHARFMP